MRGFSTEAISPDDLAALLYVARYNILEGWYPESGTAVFRDWEGDNATFVTYTLGDEDVRRYGPYDLSGGTLISISETDCYLHDSQTIYRWNFVTQEKTKIMDTPPLSQVSMNLQPDGGLFFAGIQEDDNLFLYSTAYQKPGKLEIVKNYYNHLAIGDNCVFFWSTKEFTNEISYYRCWYIRKEDA